MDPSTVLQTTLLLLYFIAPPTHEPKDEPKAIRESKNIWTLQSTSQVVTPSPDACYALGNQMIAKIDPVATMTVRAYCLCADGNGKICTDDNTLKTMMKSFTVDQKLTPTVEAVGRTKRLPSASGPAKQ